MHFGENQLSRSLIGLSPLPTGHPPGFQPWWVRSSTLSYQCFNLPMGRSLRFGSRARDWNALFGLAFATASPHGLTSPHATNSQAHSSKGTPSPQPRGLRRIVSSRFQVLFHSPPGVLFTFPSRYLSAIGHQVVFRLSKWSCQIHTGFHGPRATREHSKETMPFHLRDYHPLRSGIQTCSTTTRFSHSLQPRQQLSEGPTTPHTQPLPGLTCTRFSLIRFRSPLLTEYLFLPVLRCFTSRRSLHTPYIFRCRSHNMTCAGFPHSDTLGSQLVCQLPEAYRRLPRPSSAPDAKASTDCS